MATEPLSFHIHIDADARLAAAIGGAARFLSDAAGLPEEAAKGFQSSVVAACCEAFGHLTAGHSHLNVTLTRFADRIEVVLAHQGESFPAVGLDAIAGFVAQVGGASGRGGLSGVDRVQYETKAGETMTRLTKYTARDPSPGTT